jgi:3'(2'), 5'-bisphosphate nucleotidase
MRNLSRVDVEYVGQIAKEAGRLALSMRQMITVSEKTGPRDFVTDADVACSKLIVDALRKHFPEDAIISEEDVTHPEAKKFQRVWMVDPIDGTENYIANDGMYSVMIGLLINNQPVYGWVYNPASDELYVAALHEGVTKYVGNERFDIPFAEATIDSDNVRLLMGNRDREKHDWVENVPGVDFIYSGSVGLRVAMIIEGRADIYMHLSGKLRSWDTAGPLAMAHAAGLEVGSVEFNSVPYVIGGNHMHEYPIAVGLPGTLAWMRNSIKRHAREPVAAVATLDPALVL